MCAKSGCEYEEGNEEIPEESNEGDCAEACVEVHKVCNGMKLGMGTCEVLGAAEQGIQVS